MTKFNAKHTTELIDGTMCSLVETGVSEERLAFLTKVLQKNNYQVFSEKTGEGSYKIGVSDLIFFPVIDVYKRRLKTLDNQVLSHEYWFQVAERPKNYD